MKKMNQTYSHLTLTLNYSDSTQNSGRSKTPKGTLSKTFVRPTLTTTTACMTKCLLWHNSQLVLHTILMPQMMQV